MSRGKSILLISYSMLLILILICCSDFSKDYSLTEKYGYQFRPDSHITCPHSAKDIDYYRVVSYDGSNAQIYYVDSDGCEAQLITLKRENYSWKTVSSYDIKWKSKGEFSEFSGLYWCLGNCFFSQR